MDKKEFQIHLWRMLKKIEEEFDGKHAVLTISPDCGMVTIDDLMPMERKTLWDADTLSEFVGKYF